MPKPLILRALRSKRDDPPQFSFYHDRATPTGFPTSPTKNTCALIRQNLDKSSCTVEPNSGPRYCPCIEDKIVRWRKTVIKFYWARRAFTREVHPNGLSNSSPLDVQVAFFGGYIVIGKCWWCDPDMPAEWWPISILDGTFSNSVCGKTSVSRFVHGQINEPQVRRAAAPELLWRVSMLCCRWMQTKEPFVLSPRAKLSWFSAHWWLGRQRCNRTLSHVRCTRGASSSPAGRYNADERLTTPWGLRIWGFESLADNIENLKINNRI